MCKMGTSALCSRFETLALQKYSFLFCFVLFDLGYSSVTECLSRMQNSQHKISKTADCMVAHFGCVGRLVILMQEAIEFDDR